MNLQDVKHETDQPANQLKYVNFNGDYTSLLTGRNGDYNIYTLANISKSLPLLYTFPSNDEVILVERLLSTSLIVFVTASQPSRLVLHHFRNQKEVCTYNFPTNILAVKLNKSCFVVCLEDSISIHSIRDLRTLHVIRDVPLNTHITCTLSPNSPTNCFVAYPASNHSGEVAIFDAENLRPVWSIDAHDTVIAAMTFSYDGLLLATASVKGTVIRVFSVASRSKVFEFRRSMKRCATVYSLAFSKDGKFLCCSSSTETVHIFKIDLQKLNAMNQEVPSNENQGWMDYLGQAIKSSTTYLPAQVTEVLSQERGFAVARLPSSCSSFTATATAAVTASLSSSPANTAAVASSPTAAAASSAAAAAGGRNVCGITSIEGGTYVMIVQQNAEMLVYNVDVVNGGECNVVAQYSLNISGIPLHHHHHLPPPPPPHHHHQPPVPRSVQPPPSSSVPSSLSSSTQEQSSPAPLSSSSSSSIDQDTTPTDCHSPLNDLEWMKVKKLPRANTSPQWSPCRRSYASVVNSQDSGDARGDGACRDGSGCCRSGDCSPAEIASPSTSSSSGSSSSSSASSSSLASSSLQPPSQIRSDQQPPQRLQPTKQQQQQQQLQQKKQPQQPQNIYYQHHQNQMLKFEGELVLRDAIVSIEDLYLDAECGWLEDSSEFPSIIKKK